MMADRAVRAYCLISMSFLTVAIAAAATPAHAWSDHSRLVMEPTLRKVIAPHSPLGLRLDERFEVRCDASPADDVSKRYAVLAAELHLNPEGGKKLGPTLSKEHCARKWVTGREILAREFADDPDLGMDQNLPDGEDPENFRAWMGGPSGETSQGFRHMFFGGWSPAHPVTTLQIPPGAIGYAPVRARILAQKARDLLRAHRSGLERAWGFRLLAWSSHFVQDLAQPFHAAQLPAQAMVPWHVLFQWPPSRGFHALVDETRRSIGNYHFAYERYISERAHKLKLSPFDLCFEQTRRFALFQTPLTLRDSQPGAPTSPPEAIARAAANASIPVAGDLGPALVQFFGSKLMAPGVDLPQGLGDPNYEDLAFRPDLTEARKLVHEVTCSALANAAEATQALIAWAALDY